MNKPEKLRLFVAVAVPGPQLEAVAKQTEELREAIKGARWAPPANQHVTLKFLGWAPREKLEAVADAVADAVAGHQRSSVSLTDLGAFPNTKRARVLWVGFDDPAGLLASMAADLDRSLEPLGFRAEKRPFTAHLTLARLRTPIRLPDLPDLDVSEPFVVEGVGLWRSHLSPKGSTYEVVGDFPLG